VGLGSAPVALPLALAQRRSLDSELLLLLGETQAEGDAHPKPLVWEVEVVVDFQQVRRSVLELRQGLWQLQAGGVAAVAAAAVVVGLAQRLLLREGRPRHQAVEEGLLSSLHLAHSGLRAVVVVAVVVGLVVRSLVVVPGGVQLAALAVAEAVGLVNLQMAVAAVGLVAKQPSAVVLQLSAVEEAVVVVGLVVKRPVVVRAAAVVEAGAEASKLDSDPTVQPPARPSPASTVAPTSTHNLEAFRRVRFLQVVGEDVAGAVGSTTGDAAVVRFTMVDVDVVEVAATAVDDLVVVLVVAVERSSQTPHRRVVAVPEWWHPFTMQVVDLLVVWSRRCLPSRRCCRPTTCTRCVA
jgi:hypothetical protein